MSCNELAYVRFWHKADMAIALNDVRFWHLAGKFRNFAAQFNRYPISPAANPCCNPRLKISVVLSL